MSVCVYVCMCILLEGGREYEKAQICSSEWEFKESRERENVKKL
jgi:hypothetical protein